MYILCWFKKMSNKQQILINSSSFPQANICFKSIKVHICDGILKARWSIHEHGTWGWTHNPMNFTAYTHFGCAFFQAKLCRLLLSPKSNESMQMQTFIIERQARSRRRLELRICERTLAANGSATICAVHQICACLHVCLYISPHSRGVCACTRREQPLAYRLHPRALANTHWESSLRPSRESR